MVSNELYFAPNVTEAIAITIFNHNDRGRDQVDRRKIRASAKLDSVIGATTKLSKYMRDIKKCEFFALTNAGNYNEEGCGRWPVFDIVQIRPWSRRVK